MPTTGVNAISFALYAIVAWYAFQVLSRKKQQVSFKIKRMFAGGFGYGLAAWLLAEQGLPPVEAVIAAILIGLGTGWLFVSPPIRNRRIPKAARREVIERDLTSRGLKWDPTRHHIDHVVPYSRGGDHSPRNLRVIEKQRNLRKGAKMPRLHDFIKDN